MDEVQMNYILGSSNISQAGFNEKTNTMRILFHNGGLYEAPATKADYDGFMAAKSKGKHFNGILKKACTWKKVIEKKGDL